MDTTYLGILTEECRKHGQAEDLVVQMILYTYYREKYFSGPISNVMTLNITKIVGSAL